VTQKKLGELLLEAAAITADDLQRALEIQQTSGERLGSILVRLDIVDSRMLASVLGAQQNVDGIDLRDNKPTADALALLTPELARRLGCLPLRLDSGILSVAMVDPRDETVVAELVRHTGKQVKRMVAPQTMIYSAIVQYYGSVAFG
jgi:type IV pilus assembly protein PilB